MKNAVLYRDLQRVAINGGGFEEQVAQNAVDYIRQLEEQEERLHKLEEFLNSCEDSYPETKEDFMNRAKAQRIAGNG